MSYVAHALDRGSRAGRLVTAYTTVPLAERFMSQLPNIAIRAVGQIATEITHYGSLPRDILDGKIVDFTKQSYEIFGRTLCESRQMTEEELAVALSAAAHGARTAVPLSALLAACNVASRVGMEAVQELATPSELDQVLLVANRCQRYLQQLVPAITTAYLEHAQSPYSHVHVARRTLFNALMNGAPSVQTAKHADMTLASRYSVMHLLVLNPCETMATRRRLHHIQEILDAHVHQTVLTSLDAHGGTILLPATDREEALMGPITEAAGGPVMVGLCHAAPLDIASAAQEACEVAVLASDLGRAPRLFRLRDLIVEYQLTRPSRARDLLAERLEPLVEHPHLKQALIAYLRHEHSRKLAAKSLFIHPNTLDYRLRRVAELTGLDPALPSAARILSAAVLTTHIRGPGSDKHCIAGKSSGQG